MNVRAVPILILAALLPFGLPVYQVDRWWRALVIVGTTLAPSSHPAAGLRQSPD